MSFREYHKITTVWKRDPANHYKTLIGGAWATPEFDYLQDDVWAWTEKVDGTNLRIMWDGDDARVRFGGRAERSQIMTELIDRMQDLFPAPLLAETFGTEGEMMLCGEGYGARVQKGGGNYLPNSVDFILFDVWAGAWLERKNVEDIAKKLDIRIVPIVGRGTLTEAIEFAHLGEFSRIASNPSHEMEGLVMRPETELLTRRGDRVITKIKFKDWARGGA